MPWPRTRAIGSTKSESPLMTMNTSDSRRQAPAIMCVARPTSNPSCRALASGLRQESVHANRQLGDPYAHCGVDGIGHRSRPRNSRGLAYMLRSKRTVGRWHLDQHHINAWSEVNGRYLAISKACSAQVTINVYCLLSNCSTNALQCASLDLPKYLSRINRTTHVLYHSELNDSKRAGLAVDIHPGEVHHKDRRTLIHGHPPLTLNRAILAFDALGQQDELPN